MRLTRINITIFALLSLPVLAFSQVHERGMMKNRTNVENESSEYTLGIFRDTNQYRNSLIEFGTYGDDVAAETEEEILYASFDTKVCHYLNKFDYSNMTGSIPVRLTNEKQKKYFTCPVEGVLTSHFGPRRNRFHYGTDIGLRTGSPIKSMFDGVVRYAKWCNGYGNLVVVRHDNGLETYYGHMSKISAKENQRVKAGDVIGLVGSTGRSTGPHLHLEIRYLGAAMDPEHFIDFKDYTLKCENEVFHITRSDFKPTYSKGASSSRQLAKTTTKKSKKSRNSSAVATHTVRKGETLDKIAKKHGTTVAKLKKLNGIKETNIKSGQKIKVK
ncbi:MAG: peptidoglycan DD-metalloendopeptidase family protein [Bacteroidales bacterium]|nr:peptidoglycan DD-metalloendopeptidase family protein [Bacteroidales bacterium]